MRSISVCLLFNVIFGFLSAQNVGIGTLKPISKLTVRESGIGITQESPDSTTRVGFYASNGLAFVQTHTNHDLQFSTNNGNAQLTLQRGTGNLGVGRNNPQAKLDVMGSVRIADGTEGANKVLTSDGNGLASWKVTALTNVERIAVTTYSNKVNGNTYKVLYNTGSGIIVNNFSAGPDSLKKKGISVSVTKAGLYHFKINGRGEVAENCNVTTSNMTFYFIGPGGIILNLVAPVICGSPNTTLSSTFTIDTDIDIYLQPGWGYLFEENLNTFVTPSYIQLTIIGHLVSE